jgi:succinate-semialdehyde dehydrogenase/glutarate-semialdehyde dehydrogenase
VGYPEIAMLIDGEWIADARETRTVENPATRSSIGVVPLATPADLDRALGAAGRAFASWRNTPPGERASVISRAAALLRVRLEPIARAMTLENGKPIRESRSEVAYSADIVDFLASQAVRTYGTAIPSATGRSILAAEPIGPVAAFTPWNYPLIVPARKIAAALAAGCTIIIKPDEETPASALAFATALQDAGLPPGVLNVVFGHPAQVSETLINSPVVRKVSFTGSTPVGKRLASLAGSVAKPTMLELGGHAPVIVFEDADVDAVARMAVGSKFHNAGQSCGSPTRFYLHESVHDRFVEQFARHASDLVVGDGMLESTDIGSLANSRRLAAMAPLVDDAVARGAELVIGGPLEGDGYYWSPTILSRVPDDARAMNEEPFGPIALTTTFVELDDVVARANSLPFGLGAYIFTRSAERSIAVPRDIEAGMVGVNQFNLGGFDTFFGGVKESGYGSEGGPEAVEEYLVRKLILQA